MRYEDFVLENLFIIDSTKSLDAGKLTFTDEGINFVGRVSENNGVQGKIAKQDFEPNNANTLTATVIGNYKYVKYQQEPYYCSQNINKLTPKFEINEKIALYFCTVISKFVSLYNGQQGGYKLNQLKEYICRLPIKTDENGNPIIDDTHFYHKEGFVPDFEYMQKHIEELEQKHIEELEQERIEELERYLVATGLNDYELTDEDIETLSLSGFGDYEERDNEDAVKICKEFKISDLFELQKVSNKLAKEDLSDEYVYPAYSSDTGNNGIIGYADNPEFVCDDKTPVYVTFGDHTRTLNIARKSFSVLDNVKVLIPCYDNDEVLLYLTSEWQKQIPNLGYARHWKVAKDCILSLPIKTDTNNNPIIDTECKYHPDGYIPDFDFMAKYIKVIEKIVIADVVQYKDAIISKTKEVVA